MHALYHRISCANQPARDADGSGHQCSLLDSGSPARCSVLAEEMPPRSPEHHTGITIITKKTNYRYFPGRCSTLLPVHLYVMHTVCMYVCMCACTHACMHVCDVRVEDIDDVPCSTVSQTRHYCRHLGQCASERHHLSWWWGMTMESGVVPRDPSHFSPHAAAAAETASLCCS